MSEERLIDLEDLLDEHYSNIEHWKIKEDAARKRIKTDPKNLAKHVTEMNAAIYAQNLVKEELVKTQKEIDELEEQLKK